MLLPKSGNGRKEVSRWLSLLSLQSFRQSVFWIQGWAGIAYQSIRWRVLQGLEADGLCRVYLYHTNTRYFRISLVQCRYQAARTVKNEAHEGLHIRWLDRRICFVKLQPPTKASRATLPIRKYMEKEYEEWTLELCIWYQSLHAEQVIERGVSVIYLYKISLVLTLHHRLIHLQPPKPAVFELGYTIWRL